MAVDGREYMQQDHEEDAPRDPSIICPDAFQDSDDLTPQDIQFNVVSENKPQDSELRDAEFAWLCVKHVKSNAIVIAKVCTFIL